MKKVLLIDDHEIVKAGLAAFLENEIPGVVIHYAGDSEPALQKINDEEYHLVVLDVNIPGVDSCKLLGEILKMAPKTIVLIFSMNNEMIYAKKYLQLGAKGYISKSAPVEDLRTAIVTVLQNKRYLNTALKELLLEDYLAGKALDNPFVDLSSRELEVFNRVMRGETTVQICDSLHLRSSTVATYKARLFEKLKCKNIVDLKLLAKLHGMI